MNRAMKECLGNTVVFDLESDGLRDDATRIHVIVAWDPTRGELVHFWDDGPDVYHISGEPIQRDGTVQDGAAWLARCPSIAAHNALDYDLPVLSRLTIEDFEGRTYPDVVDTLLLSKWLWPSLTTPPGCKSGPHSLDAWGIRLGRGKPVHEDWSKFTPGMLHRCREDVMINVALFEKQREELEKRDHPLTEWSIRTEHDFACLCRQTWKHGFPFRKDYAEQLVEWCQQRMDVLEGRILRFFPPRVIIKETRDSETGQLQLQKAFKKDGTPTARTREYWGEDVGVIAGDYCRVGFEPIDLGSQKQVKDALLYLGWKPTEWNVSKKTGKITSPKLTEDSFSTIPPGVGQDIAQWLQFNHRRNLLKGLCERAEYNSMEDCWFIPFSIDTHGTVSGRVTHRAVVNIPNPGSFLGKEIRSCFTCWPGERFITTDLAGAHLHLMGCWIQEMDGGQYIKALLEGDKSQGTDNHSLLAKAVGLSRDDAKTLIYLWLNGGREGRLASELGMSKEKAKRVLKDLDKNLPAFGKLTSALQGKWKRHGFIETMTGHRLQPGKSNEVLSYCLLSTEAAIQKRAAVIAWRWIEAERIPARFLIFYHDEVNWSAPPEYAERVKQFTEESVRVACEEIGLSPPMRAEGVIDYSWAAH